MTLPTTITLNLPEREMTALEKMCKDKDMSKTAILRQAFRMYQSVDELMRRQGISSIWDLTNHLPPELGKGTESEL